MPTSNRTWSLPLPVQPCDTIVPPCLAGRRHQVLDDQRPRQRRHQRVAVHVEGVGPQRRQAEVGGELLPGVDHLGLDRAAVQRPLPDDVHVLAALADVDRDRDHLGAGLLGQVRDGDRGVQSPREREHHTLGHVALSFSRDRVHRRPTRAAVAASAAPTEPSTGSACRATTRIVSSPAMVPTTSGRPDRSSALARNWAAPGGVRSTTRLPLASAPVSSSRSSRRSRSGACSAVRSGAAALLRDHVRRGGAVGAAHLDRAQLLQVARERGLRGGQALGGEQLAQLGLRAHRPVPDQRDDAGVPGGLRHRCGHHVAPTRPRGPPQQPGQQRLLRVQPVLGLVEHRAGRAVHHLVGDLLAAVRRQAVQHDRAAARPRRAARR